MKINVLSPGRFHVCDLSRELSKNGFDVKFYSFVPTKRAMKFGLPKQCSASLFVYLLPLLLLEKKIFKKRWATRLRVIIQDYLTGILMRRCDVLIAMSGDFLYAVKKAKRQGAVIILERGSKHILEQRRILESIPSLRGTKPVPDINVKRELAGYKLADYIAVASQHVVDSFLIHGYPKEKLFKNPYGVDLRMFYPQPDVEKKYDFIMVGSWCYQKGCDLIVEAIRKTNYTFLHVGAIKDLEFPQEPTFTHVDAVDQSQLVNYYAQAKVFIFPSRQDGFGMVLSQALACNLPIIGSKDCGAPDLREMVAIPEYITIVTEYTPDAVAKSIETAMANYKKLGNNVYAGNAIDNLTWEAYGKRYAVKLNNIISQMGGVIVKQLYYKYSLIMVGGWSYRKGCDLIVEAVKRTNLTLLHVGGIVDMPFPEDERFTHHDAVDQKELVNYYHQAKVFILPSREEGLAMVQAQAIACNLPLIGSPDSGAEDLKAMVECPEYVTIIKSYTVEAVVDAIHASMALYDKLGHKRYAGNAKEILSWEAYGKRYADFLRSVI